MERSPRPRVDLDEVNLRDCLLEPSEREKLDLIVTRDTDDAVWTLPSDAISMSITFLRPFECVNKALVHTRGTEEVRLPKETHAWPALAKRPDGKIVQLHYTLEVMYRFGTITIDPMVDIQP